MLTLALSQSSIGSANAQETTQTDSLTTAFFLLQYDYDILKASTKGQAQLDSLRINQMQTFFDERLKEEIALRNRGYLIMAFSVILAGGLIYLGGQL